MTNYLQDIKLICLSNSKKSHWKEQLTKQIKDPYKKELEIDAQDLLLTCKDIRDLNNIVERNQLKITRFRSHLPETIVSASSLGFETLLTLSSCKKSNQEKYPQSSSSYINNDELFKLLLHQGTLRSGENLTGEGDILLLGDVNPGAKVEARGDILIWGRLRGIAHAGKDGNRQAKIVALELRPLQLRIANAIALGPQEKPEEGLAEEAHLVGEQIIIEPAKPGNFNTAKNNANPTHTKTI